MAKKAKPAATKKPKLADFRLDNRNAVKLPEERVKKVNVSFNPEDRAILERLGKKLNAEGRIMPILRYALRVADAAQK